MPSTFSRSPESLNTELKQAREKSIEEINRISGEIRQKYLTTIPGQEMLYKSKETEARAVLAAPDASTLEEEDFPFLAAEIGVNGADLSEVANLVLTLSAQWSVIGSQLERVRLSHAKMIKAATSRAEIESAMQSFYDQVASA